MRSVYSKLCSTIAWLFALGVSSSTFAALTEEAEIRIPPAESVLGRAERDGLSLEQRAFLSDLMQRLENADQPERNRILDQLWVSGHWAGRYFMQMFAGDRTMRSF